MSGEFHAQRSLAGYSLWDHKRVGHDLATKTTAKIGIYTDIMYRCENWVIKKAECSRTDVFKLWGWRRFLRVP